MAVATLSLGETSFDLSDDLNTTKVSGRYPTLNVRSALGTSSTIDDLLVTTSAPASNNLLFSSGVNGLEADLGDCNDTLIFTSRSSVESSNIDLGAGNDVFRADGGFNFSNVDAGSGNDTLTFNGLVLESLDINSGSGNDVLTFKSGTTIFDTTIATESGNDVVQFFGDVFGGGANSLISLGTGADTLVFGANSFVSGYNIDLGSDVSVDNVVFNAGLDESNDVTITGAGTGDSLFIGAGDFAGTYTFDGTDFSNDSDTLTWLT
jgi:hypothetical protein